MIDRPQTGQVVSKRCVRRERLDGTCKLRFAARGSEQTVSPNADFYGGTLNLATLRRLLTLAAIWSLSGIASLLFTRHPCRMILNLCTLDFCLRQEYNIQRFRCARRRFQGVKISPRASGIHSTENIGTMGYEQLKSDPSTHVAKREKRKDDSILLRHMHNSSEKHPKSISCEILNA